jgi:hypothetical protein
LAFSEKVMNSIGYQSGNWPGMVFLVAVLLLGIFPLAASASSKTGKLADLARYVGTNHGDLPITLDNELAVQAELQHFPKSVRTHLKRNLDVRRAVPIAARWWAAIAASGFGTANRLPPRTQVIGSNTR